jgi:hypothetical protein
MSTTKMPGIVVSIRSAFLLVRPKICQVCDWSKTPVERAMCGGVGDMKRLGGFTECDDAGVSPALWTMMTQEFGVHSLIDVDCGRGTSTRWFYEHNVDVLEKTGMNSHGC